LLNLPAPSVSEGMPLLMGSPSTRTIWQPIPNFGEFLQSATASSKARELAISVADVTTPSRFARSMARFTPEVSPKSSALMMSRGTKLIVAAKQLEYLQTNQKMFLLTIFFLPLASLALGLWIWRLAHKRGWDQILPVFSRYIAFYCI